MAQVRIWWDPDAKAYRLLTPFNQGFLDLFKTAFPASDRWWDKDARQWLFTEPRLQNVINLVKLVYKVDAVLVKRSDVEAKQSEARSAERLSKLSIDEVIVQYFKLLPFEAARASYRSAATALHPDKDGGDASKMSSLNAAWSRIEKDLFKK